jgi:rubrerythrin
MRGETKMNDETSSAIETLREAMLNEQATRDFYLDAAGKVLDEKGQEMFKELAAEEVVHMTIVWKQYESLKAGQGWTVVADFDRLGDVDITPLQFKREQMKSAVRESTSDLNALVLAAEMENNSFVYYTERYSAATEPLAKRLYGGLIKAERNHFNLVMSNWEALVNTGFWK